MDRFLFSILSNEPEQIDWKPTLIGGGILLAFFLFLLLGFFKIGLKKHNGNHKMLNHYVKCNAKVIGYSEDFEKRVSKFGTTDIVYDEMKIEYHDESGKVFTKFTQNVENDGYIQIYYKEDNPHQFEPAYLIEEDDDYYGDYVYGMSIRILLGVLSAVFGIALIVFALNVFL